MPWKESSSMSLREEFVRLAMRDGANVSELCRRFGISRKSGYKWINRFDPNDAVSLMDRSRTPKSSPWRTGDEVEQQVIAARLAHPAWGPRKLRHVLLRAQREQQDASSAPKPQLKIPAASTIGKILLRHQLIEPGESNKHRAWQRFEKAHPNELWQMDFKGHVPMLDGGRCHPLTVLDDHSRFNIGLFACGDEQMTTVKPCLIKLFERYGQPARMLCDNGSPWGNTSEEPHTLLSVWLLRHGIRVSHGRPYHPQTQGKDERFHRTLKCELLAREVMRDIAHSQMRFDAFRDEYNQVRPHDALGMDCPIAHYQPSARAYQPDPLPPVEYDAGVQVRIVDASGKISFRGASYKIGRAFVGQRVALRANDEVDGRFDVLFADHTIGQIDLRAGMSRRSLRSRRLIPARRKVSPMSPNVCNPCVRSVHPSGERE
jgi:transposase InsO family protein